MSAGSPSPFAHQQLGSDSDSDSECEEQPMRILSVAAAGAPRQRASRANPGEQAQRGQGLRASLTGEMVPLADGCLEEYPKLNADYSNDERLNMVGSAGRLAAYGELLPPGSTCEGMWCTRNWDDPKNESCKKACLAAGMAKLEEYRNRNVNGSAGTAVRPLYVMDDGTKKTLLQVLHTYFKSQKNQTQKERARAMKHREGRAAGSIVIRESALAEEARQREIVNSDDRKKRVSYPQGGSCARACALLQHRCRLIADTYRRAV
jgi:hypothetical protein